MSGTKFSSAPANRADVRSLIVVIAENVRKLKDSRLAKWAAIANIIGLPIAALTLLVGLQPTPKQPPPISQPFRITQPADGAPVGQLIRVHGTALIDGKRHRYYLIVTPPLGSAQIQADAMDLSAGGGLDGRAVLGTGSVGAAKSFTVQILACGTAPRSLQQPPPDCVPSTPITVIRQN